MKTSKEPGRYDGPPNDEVVARVAEWYGHGCPLGLAATLAGCDPKTVRGWMREGKAAYLKKKGGGKLTAQERAMRRARRTLRAAQSAFIAALLASAKKEGK